MRGWRTGQDCGAGLVFLSSLGCSSVLVDQAVDDVSALDPGSNVGRLAGLVQRRSLFPHWWGRCSL